ncbi:hypothetical protein AB6A40_009105 [Gnathostoma spinigerum]|uniref:Uncharacterized protein n=1 Tax=Gnathostoma spinigerum TaxID=75299 RepID=A0ABD6ESU9_9BILA
MRVPQCDQLMRVERLMRASSAEMMLAFVSGTLRRHFRSSGLAHPPDIGATIPVALRRSSDISADSECNSIMVPLRIPCGVEGTIPRLWAVQRRLAHAVNGVLPDALRVSRLLLDLFCSSKGDRLFFNKVYSDTSIVVSVLRMEGHLSFENQRIQSLLLFPSMPSTVKVAFTFVQCGSSTMLSVSADRLTFPNPELLLIHFKAEVNNFLEQLSLRLLTLSQATFLPFSVPCVNESEETDETVNKSRPTSEVTVNIGEGEEFDVEKCSIEQLRAHISKVQKELDDMKAESYCGPVDNEKKLKELESAMNAMHEKMAKLLGSPSYTVPRKNENDELTSNVVDELLAPYREEMGARTRRFSREFIRLDTPRLQPRRESAPPRANM